MIKNLIWDFDGTLFDTYPVMMRAFIQALHDYNLTQIDRKDLYRLMKIKSIRFATEYFQRVYGVDKQALSDRYHAYEAQMQQTPQPYPGVLSVLKENTSIGGINLLETHRNQQAQTYLEANGLAMYFSGGVTATDKFPRKPNPAGIQSLIERFHLNPSVTAMVGDRRLDIEAGSNANIKTIYFNVDHFDDAPMATWQVSRIDQICQLIQK